MAVLNMDGFQFGLTEFMQQVCEVSRPLVTM